MKIFPSLINLLIRYGLQSVLLSFIVSSSVAQDIYFEDTDPFIILVGNKDHYEVGIRKTNGSIAYITDKDTGKKVCQGGRYEVLWGTLAFDSDPLYIGSTKFFAGAANDFSYEWNNTDNVLKLLYEPDPNDTQKLSVMVELRFTRSNQLDMYMTLKNERDVALDMVIFPSDFVFLEHEIESALLPVMPGILLHSTFFEQSRSYGIRYPGWPGTIADFTSIEASSGSFAMFSLHENEDKLHMVDFGFTHDDEYLAKSTILNHNFQTFIGPGDSWNSPVVRILIGNDHPSSIFAMRMDNRIEDFISLKEKTGLKYEKISQSVLLKTGIKSLAGLYPTYKSLEGLVDLIPTPSILHLVEFNPGPFDHNYPDFIPPDPEFGSYQDFENLILKAQENGLLVMPYINPTWWDEASPTVTQQLPPLNVKDIAVLDNFNNPVYESYNNNEGILVSPHNTFVTDRLDHLMSDLTAELSCDMIFEDQIGARAGIKDHHPDAPNATSYHMGWKKHTELYKDLLLSTEMGFDRIIDTEFAFFGSALLSARTDPYFQALLSDCYEFYPFTALFARDKLMFYEHNLAPETSTFNLATLTHNISMGYNLHFDLATGIPQYQDWLDVCSDFQKYVLSGYVDKRMQYFTVSPGSMKQYYYPNTMVLVNQHKTSSLSYNNHVISQGGFLIESQNGAVIAGVFDAYQGQGLNNNQHYLYEKRMDAQTIQIGHPMGDDTEFSTLRPIEWTMDGLVKVYAVFKDKTVVELSSQVTGQKISFELKSEIDGRLTDHFMVTYDKNLTNNPEIQIDAEINLQMAPNPFQNGTRISYRLSNQYYTSIEILNMSGQYVETLFSGLQDPGDHEVKFNSTNLVTGNYLLSISLSDPIIKTQSQYRILRKMIRN